MPRPAPAATLSLFRPLWGLIVEDGGVMTLDAALAAIQQRGYKGVECSVGLAASLGTPHDTFADRIAAHDLHWAPMLFTCPLDAANPFVGSHPTAGPGSSPAVHFAAWRGQMAAALDLGVPQERIAFVNSITGHDSMEWGAAVELFERIEEWYDAHGGRAHTPLVHETHRGRVLNSPWVTRRLVRALPRVRLAADLAHFTCVTESIGAPTPQGDAEGQDERGEDAMYRDVLTEAIMDIAGSVGHVHGRIGCDQSPQVADPRGEGERVLRERFEGWWDAIWRAQLARGVTDCTFTPEAGPRPYQPDWGGLTEAEAADPAMHVRLAGKLDDINEWTADRARNRFRDLIEARGGAASSSG